MSNTPVHQTRSSRLRMNASGNKNSMTESVVMNNGCHTIRSKSPYHKPQNLQHLNFIKDIEKLRKEIDRKDIRNDSMMAEMQGLRNQQGAQQRELRIMGTTFEKCNNERQKLVNECARCKEYIDKLELQLARLGDVSQLTTQLDDCYNEIDTLKYSNDQLQQSNASKDDRIIKLSKEIEIFNRSEILQNEFEKRQTNDFINIGNGGTAGAAGILGAPNNDTVTYRSLYYELGKRQTDSHSLAIALASSNNELKQLSKKYDEMNNKYIQLKVEKENITVHSNHLTKQSVLHQDDISQLMDKLNEYKILNTNLSKKNYELINKYNDKENECTMLITNNNNKMNEYKDIIKNNNNNINKLKLKIDNLNATISHIEQVKNNNEKRLNLERNRYSEEKGIYADKIKNTNNIIKERDLLRSQIKELALFREQNTIERDIWYNEKKNYNNEINNFQILIENMKLREEELLKDRESSVKALHQTILATKELSTRYNNEKVKRISAEDRLLASDERASTAEKIAETLHRTRETVSGAVIDALNNERNRSTQLQKDLFDKEKEKCKSKEKKNDTNVSHNSHNSDNSDNSDNNPNDPFGGEDLFANMPPHPPGAPASSPFKEMNPSFSPSSSANTSINSTGTGKDVKAELNRLRQELNQMEASRPV